MVEAKKCPQCGEEIPADAPEGLCPNCLLKVDLLANVGSQPESEPGLTTPYTGRFVPPQPAELAPQFPQLEILELLGQGGMGAVYKARQPGLDRLVALKILPREIGADPAFAERFTREARALARLSHPNIVAVYDFGQTSTLPSPSGRGAGGEGGDTEGSLFYFIMEYVDGVNLRQAIQSGGMSPKEALAIVPQICDALQFAHDEGIVHRDIKPENILVDKKGRVKIADFGLAKLLGHAPSDVSLTAPQQVMGTLRYMAPEQLEGTKSVDHRADIYSLGVVFYELLTGELPIGRFAPPSKKVQIDVRLDEVVLRALEKEPEQRYQHASEVKSDVEGIARGTQVPPAPAARPDQSSASGDSPPMAVPAGPDASRSVQGPAIGLLATSIVSLLSVLLLWVPLVALLWPHPEPARDAIVLPGAGQLPPAAELGAPERHMSVPEQFRLSLRAFFLTGGLLVAVPIVFGAIVSLLILIGAIRMRRLESLGWARTSAVLAMIPLPLPCPLAWPLGLAMGIWALVVLSRPEVKAAFASAAKPREFAPLTPSDRVRWPAIGIILGAVINGAVWLIFTVADIGSRAGTHHSQVFFCFSMGIVVMMILVILGAWQMISLGSYRMAVFSSFLSLIPMGIGSLIAVPFAIWALAVLTRPEVKAAFAARTASGGGASPPLLSGSAEANQQNRLGRISLWAAIAGLVLPIVLVLGIGVLDSVLKLGLSDGLLMLCGMLGIVLELVALGCGIVGRRAASGKAGLIISVISLALYALMFPVVMISPAGSDRGPEPQVETSDAVAEQPPALYSPTASKMAANPVKGPDLPLPRPDLTALASAKAGKDESKADLAAIHDLALRMLAAIADKDDAVLNEVSADALQGWRQALPQIASEVRESYQVQTGKPLTAARDIGFGGPGIHIGASGVVADLGWVQCCGPKELGESGLVLFFVKTKSGWRNFFLRGYGPADPPFATPADDWRVRFDALARETGFKVVADRSQIPAIGTPGREDYAFTITGRAEHALFVWLELWKDGKLLDDTATFGTTQICPTGTPIDTTLRMTTMDGDVASVESAGKIRIDWKVGTGSLGDWKPNPLKQVKEASVGGHWSIPDQWQPKPGETMTLVALCAYRGSHSSEDRLTEAALLKGRPAAAILLRARFDPLPPDRTKKNSWETITGGPLDPRRLTPAQFAIAKQLGADLSACKTPEESHRALVAQAGTQEGRARAEQMLQDFGMTPAPNATPEELVNKLEEIVRKLADDSNSAKATEKTPPTSPPAPQGKAELSPADARLLIPEAASMTNADSDNLAKGVASKTTDLNQTLTFVLLSLRPDEAAKTNKAALDDFRFLSEVPNPIKLANAMGKSKSKGYATVIQPEFITDCQCSTKGDTATGTVSFTAAGVYSGKVEFIARRKDGVWRIEEFTLPGYGIKTVRGDDGKWTKSDLQPKGEPSGQGAKGPKSTPLSPRPADLQFRIVPNAPGSARKPAYPESVGQTQERFAAAVVDELAKKGPSAAQPAGGEFCWCELLPKIDLPNAITGEYQGKKYVLLCAREPFVMVSQPKDQDAWVLEDVSMNWTGDRSEVRIGLRFNRRGGELLGALTKANLQNRLAIVVGGRVVSAPKIMMEIHNDVMITGRFSEQEVQDLLDSLRGDVHKGR